MRRFPPRTPAPKPKVKGNWIGAPAAYKLELACNHLWKAFCQKGGGIYTVGSVLQTKDFRDVDIRLILPDDEFLALFGVKADSTWDRTSRWLVMTVSISMWLKEQTGLNIDFQFQPQSYANERHRGMRDATGLSAIIDQ